MNTSALFLFWVVPIVLALFAGAGIATLVCQYRYSRRLEELIKTFSTTKSD